MASLIRTYRAPRQADAARLFSQDAEVLASSGWRPVGGASWAEGRSGCLRVLLLGFVFAYFIRPPGSMVVTYEGGGGAVPPEPTMPRDWRPLIVLVVVVFALVALMALGSTR
ncbi:MAG TPA: hypothetical protein VF781_15505 [Solirubrobacteraceae bacterium]